ncbi:hypothetical protein B0H12DRAFT_1297319 [Mycena haematopus]|nr:hypothetical protein B0H12DRAFT_1297319 [Mycena haematopus]
MVSVLFDARDFSVLGIFRCSGCDRDAKRGRKGSIGEEAGRYPPRRLHAPAAGGGSRIRAARNVLEMTMFERARDDTFLLNAIEMAFDARDANVLGMTFCERDSFRMRMRSKAGSAKEAGCTSEKRPGRSFPSVQSKLNYTFAPGPPDTSRAELTVTTSNLSATHALL